MEVKFVSKEDVYALRHKILRPHRPFTEIVYDTDLHPGTLHVGAYHNNQLISIASFNRAKLVDGFGYDETETIEPHYRLRAMATLPDYRKLGAGKAVVKFAEAYLSNAGISLIWCRGRISVQGYYEALGFKKYGEIYDYPTLGDHITLYKEI